MPLVLVQLHVMHGLWVNISLLETSTYHKSREIFLDNFGMERDSRIQQRSLDFWPK